ncbi:hypothetical protein KI387_033471, partial [Taxus chinensis]
PLLGLEVNYSQTNRQPSPSLSTWADNYSSNYLSSQTPPHRTSSSSSFRIEEFDQFTQTQQPEPSSSNNMMFTRESTSSPQ